MGHAHHRHSRPILLEMGAHPRLALWDKDLPAIVIELCPFSSCRWVSFADVTIMLIDFTAGLRISSVVRAKFLDISSSAETRLITVHSSRSEASLAQSLCKEALDAAH
jgi:hypothetical protein